MKRLLQSLLAVLGCCTGCSQSDVIAPEQFTREFADALRQSQPNKIEYPGGRIR